MNDNEIDRLIVLLEWINRFNEGELEQIEIRINWRRTELERLKKMRSIAAQGRGR